MSDRRIRLYLAGLLRAAEVVIEPKLWPTFLGALRLVPGTLQQMASFR